MKKLFLILTAIILAFALSGCEPYYPSELQDNTDYSTVNLIVTLNGHEYQSLPEQQWKPSGVRCGERIAECEYMENIFADIYLFEDDINKYYIHFGRRDQTFGYLGYTSGCIKDLVAYSDTPPQLELYRTDVRYPETIRENYDAAGYTDKKGNEWVSKDAADIDALYALVTAGEWNFINSSDFVTKKGEKVGTLRFYDDDVPGLCVPYQVIEYDGQRFLTFDFYAYYMISVHADEVINDIVTGN